MYVDCNGNFSAEGTNDGISWNAWWSVTSSGDSEYVNFTVTATTTGWVAIGFSLDPMMVSELLTKSLKVHSTLHG